MLNTCECRCFLELFSLGIWSHYSSVNGNMILRITTEETCGPSQNSDLCPLVIPLLFLWDMHTFRVLGKYLKINVQVVLITYNFWKHWKLWIWSCKIKILPESFSWAPPSPLISFESPDSLLGDWIVMACSLSLLFLTFFPRVCVNDNILHLWMAVERLYLCPLSSGAGPGLVDRAALWLSQPPCCPRNSLSNCSFSCKLYAWGGSAREGPGFYF